MSVPSQTNALVIDGDSVAIKQINVPDYKADEIVLKTSCVSINQTDVKHVDYKLATKGSVVGVECAGEVVAVGQCVTNCKVGDYIALTVSGSNIDAPEYGAFAEYVVASSKMIFRWPNIKDSSQIGLIPFGPVKTLEQANTLSVALTTAAIAINYFAKISMKPDPSLKSDIFFIWGGASSLGQAVIQLAKYCGFTVFATCSSNNNDWLRAIGCDKTFDYKEPDVVTQIQNAAGENIIYAYDCITNDNTTECTYKVVSNSRPVKLFTSLLYNAADLKCGKKDNVTFLFPLAYLATDKVKKFGELGQLESPPGLFESATEFMNRFNQLINQEPNLFKAMPLEVIPGGLEAIKKGMDMMRKKENRGKKIIIHM